jgi:hypothetical protein
LPSPGFCATGEKSPCRQASIPINRPSDDANSAAGEIRGGGKPSALPCFPAAAQKNDFYFPKTVVNYPDETEVL